MNLLGKRVVLKEIEEERKSGIIISNPIKEPIMSGKVIQASRKTPFKKGDIILVNRYHCDEIKWEKEEALLTLEEHVIGHKTK